MNKADRQETQEMLQMIIAGYVARSESQYDVIEAKLDGIKEQTTMTNGGLKQAKKDIIELRLEIAEHPCKYDERIEEVYVSMSNMTSVRKFINRALVVVSTIVATTYVGIQIFLKVKGL